MLKPTEGIDEFIRENIRYDPETGYLWWIKPLGRRKLDKPIGSYSNGYLIFGLPTATTGDNTKVYARLHRVAWFLYYGVWPDELLDHINNVGTDNRIENLRLATHKENDRNRKACKGSSSKYKGVHWHKQRQKWCSQIEHNYKKQHLGIYASEEEAARVYDKAARELHGDYARLNFPDEHEQGALHGHDL